MRIGRYNLEEGKRPYVMGILNVTPDSFSDGGNYTEIDRAMYHAQQMIQDGADIIDIGGESTRPGYTLISDEEEMARVCPVIEKVKANFDVPVTLDTYKWKVAEAGLTSGADMINDIWGLKWEDPTKPSRMAEVVVKHKSGIILMHNRKDVNYTDFVADVLSDMRESIRIAEAAGIKREDIILDPGIGFAKDLNQNLLMMKHLGDFVQELKLPVLLGTSRKSMIGLTLDLPKDEREEGTMATSVYGLMQGACIFRVHDVKKNKRALDMTFAMMQAK